MRARFGFLWVLATALVAGVAAWIAYGVGLSTHLPAVAAGAAPVYPYPVYGFGFFPFFGFLWFLFVLFVIFAVLRLLFFRGRGGWGHHYGPGPGGMPGGIEERLKDWHQKAHSEDKSAQA
jgi:hypothetical protein